MVYAGRGWFIGRGMKLFSDTIPITAGAIAAGIRGSLMLAMCCLPFTLRL
jgi:hypothetical protein